MRANVIGGDIPLTHTRARFENFAVWKLLRENLDQLDFNPAGSKTHKGNDFFYILFWMTLLETISLVLKLRDV